MPQSSSFSRVLRIATRRSALALWQAEHVRDALCARHPGLEVELLPISTKGDRILDVPLAKVGGKGLFVKELETAMLEGRADLAVHSLKDVPMELPEGLHLPVILARENPHDALVSPEYPDLDSLPLGAVVGTSSLRRQCQLRALRPDLEIRTLRGNVNTRLAKLDAGEYHAIVLAAAGLMRLGFSERIREILDPGRMLPAVGQGALGLECRSDDEQVLSLLMPLHDPETHVRVTAERAMNRTLNGGCQVPVAGYATLENNTLTLHGLVGSDDGQTVLQHGEQAPAVAAQALGERVAKALLDAGAGPILEAARVSH